MNSSWKVAYVVVLVSILSSIVAIEPQEPPSSLAASESEIYQIAELSPFARYLYQISKSSGVFDKMFDVSYKNPTEMAAGFFFSDMYLSEQMGHPYAGVLPMGSYSTGENVFSKRMTPLVYYKGFSNLVENYLTKTGIMTPFNTQSLAHAYYMELEKSLKALGELDSALSHIYAVTESYVNFFRSFGEMSREMVEYLIVECNKYYNEL